MACSICGSIITSASANTGRDIHFTAPITSLKSLGLGSGGEDLWECPECASLFVWEDHSSQSGSGNNDEETLWRLPTAELLLVRAFLRRGERPADEVAGLGSALPELSDGLRRMILEYVRAHDRAVATRLVPWMLDNADDKERRWAKDHVESVASRGDAQLVLDEISRRPPNPALDEIRGHCKKVLCTICKAIPVHSTAVVRRDAPAPPFDVFVQTRATEEIDAWECPTCQSMFFWAQDEGESGRLSRLPDYASRPLYACLHRTGPLASYDREMVLAGDNHRSLKVVLGHALERDRELVHEFVPRMLVELSRGWPGPAWMADFLCSFVDGRPADAARVSSALEKTPRSTEQTTAIAAACRRATTS